MKIRRFNAIVQKIYKASARPELWPTALNAVAEEINGYYPTLILRLPQATETAEVIAPTVPKKYARVRARLVGPKHPYATARIGLGPKAIATTYELLSKERVQNTQWYNEWARPLGVETSVTMRLGGVGHTARGLGIFCARGDAPFGIKEKRLLMQLRPHLLHSIRIQERMKRSHERRRAAETILRRCSIGVLQVDSRGRVQRANAEAIATIERGETLMEASGVVQAACIQYRVLLKEAIRAACEDCFEPTIHGQVVVADAHGRCCQQITLMPSGASDQTALLVFSDSQLPDRQAVEAIANAFQLTPAEAKSSRLLAHGLTTEEIAKRMRVQSNTVRIVLKRVFSKTGTKNQADLVRFIWQGTHRCSGYFKRLQYHKR